MKKTKTFILYFLLTATFLFTSNAMAQYTLTPSATLIKYQIFNNLSYDTIHIANNSSDTLHLKWELIQYDTLRGSYLDFCSSGNCWLGFPASGSFPTIAPGGYGWAGAHFWTGNTAVSCTAKIWLYEEGSFATGDTLTYILHTISGSGIENHEDAENSITVYPNPATDKIYIKSTNDKTKSISISCYTILGELIFSQSITGNLTEIPLDKVSKGIYFLYITAGNKKTQKKIVVSR